MSLKQLGDHHGLINVINKQTGNIYQALAPNLSSIGKEMENNYFTSNGT